MTDEVSIRRLLPADAEAYRALRLSALAESPESFGSDVATESAAPIGNAAAVLESGYVAGAFLNDRLVGIAGFRRLEREKTRHRGDIWGVYVAPRARRTGVGRRLMEHLIAYARTQVSQVHLSATADRPAVALYESLGFTRYGTEPRALFVNGRYLDEYLMVLRFD